MSTVTAGNPVTLDALFAQAGQASPDAVTFTVELPDGANVSYATGDPQVTNPSGDYWECAIGVPAEVGEYRWQAVGTAGSGDEVTETIYGTVFVIPSAVDPADSDPPGPLLGPCTTWITGEDVANCVRFEYGSDPSVFDTVAYEASMALYEISGRIFTGLCSRDGRPCRNDCSCWMTAPVSSGFLPFWWTGSASTLGGWGWRNERGDRLGCNPMSRVRLAYPSREILSVTIDGDDVPEFDADGDRNWRLDEWRYLTRMDKPGTNGSTPRRWPGCQNMSLDPDQPGTFLVRYRWGVDPPSLGRRAATEIAQQLWLACSGAPCQLPAGVTKVRRQNVEIERGLLANWLDPKKPTGLVSTDLFLRAYAGGQMSARRSAVWSPDVQQYARPFGGQSGS